MDTLTACIYCKPVPFPQHVSFDLCAGACSLYIYMKNEDIQIKNTFCFFNLNAQLTEVQPLTFISF